MSSQSYREVMKVRAMSPECRCPLVFFFCLIEFMEKAPAVVREGIITKCVSLHSSAAFTGSSSVQWLYKYWGLLV